MASGTGARARPPRPRSLAGLEWLAVGDADRRPGQREARIRAAAPLTEDLALEAAGSMWTEVDEVTWTNGRVLARRRTLLGAIELSAVPLSDPPAQAVSEAIAEALATEGIALLAWTEAPTALRARLDFLHRALGDPWPDVSDAALTQHLDSWLGPQLARVRSAQDLRRIDVTAALRAMVPWQEARRLDELAPERVQVPSGSNVRIDYSQDQPVLAVRLQEVFGWTAAPALAGGGSRCCCTCSRPRDVPPRSPRTWSPSGTTATPAYAPTSAGAIPSTPGPRTPAAHHRPPGRTGSAPASAWTGLRRPSSRSTS